MSDVNVSELLPGFGVRLSSSQKTYQSATGGMLPAGSLYAVHPDPANAIGASTGLEENPNKIWQTVRSEHSSCPLPPGTWTFRKGPFSVVVFGIVAPTSTEYAIRAEIDKSTAPGLAEPCKSVWQQRIDGNAWDGCLS